MRPWLWVGGTRILHCQRSRRLALSVPKLTVRLTVPWFGSNCGRVQLQLKRHLFLQLEVLAVNETVFSLVYTMKVQQRRVCSRSKTQCQSKEICKSEHLLKPT
jgi:hypothetical protein